MEQDLDEMDTTAPQEWISGRIGLLIGVIDAPGVLRQESVEVVENTHGSGFLSGARLSK